MKDKDIKNLSESERIRLETKKNLKGGKKFQYFMDYYFVRVMVILIIAVVIALTAWQCAHRIYADVSVLYLGEAVMTTEQQQAVETQLCALIDDVNGDGVSQVDFIYVQVPLEGIESEYYYSVLQKRALELAVGESDIIIMSPTQYDEVLAMNYEEGSEDERNFFYDISELAGGKTENGETVGLGGGYFSTLGCFEPIPEDYLIAMRFFDENRAGDEEYLRRREESCRLFACLIG